MNFISHFYLDKESTDPFYIIGIATPDLLSIYNSGLRIKASHMNQVEPGKKEADFQSFLTGLSKHFFVDQVFHSSPLFYRETSVISEMLKQHFNEDVAPRKFFIAHILLELLLDKVLIHNNPGILDRYYGLFDKLKPFEMIEGYSERISHNQLQNYSTFLMKFCENRYLYHYVDFEHLVYILKRLLRRVGIEDGNFLESDIFLDIMKEYESRLHENYQDFFDEIIAADRKR